MKLVFAVGPNGEFSNGGELPWGSPIKEDMGEYIKFTRDCTQIMGIKTWLSLPEKTKEKYKKKSYILFSRRGGDFNDYRDLKKFVVTPDDGELGFYSFIHFLRFREIHSIKAMDHCLIGGKVYIEKALDNLHLFSEVMMTQIEHHGRKYEADGFIDKEKINKLTNSSLKCSQLVFDNKEGGYTVKVNHFKKN